MTFSFVGTIHWWNSRLSPPIGFLANFWLFWLILYRTPKEMQKHSRILLQTSVLDIIFLAISTIGIPLELESNGIWLFLTEGLLFEQFHAFFGDLGGIMFIQIYFGLYMIEILGVSVQFVYRYLLLNHNFHIGFCRYLLLLSFPIVATLGFQIYGIIAFRDTVEIGNQNVEVLNGIDLSEWKFSFTMHMNKSQTTFIALVIISLFSSYAIIIFCGVKMVKFVSGHTGFSENTKRLNKQLTKTLIILALLPLLMAFRGIFTSINIAFIHNNAATTTNNLLIAQGIANQIYILLPILNPLVSIATNTPYRNAAMFWRKRKIEAKPAMVVKNAI